MNRTTRDVIAANQSIVVCQVKYKALRTELSRLSQMVGASHNSANELSDRVSALEEEQPYLRSCVSEALLESFATSDAYHQAEPRSDTRTPRPLDVELQESTRQVAGRVVSRRFASRFLFAFYGFRCRTLRSGCQRSLQTRTSSAASTSFDYGFWRAFEASTTISRYARHHGPSAPH